MTRLSAQCSDPAHAEGLHPDTLADITVKTPLAKEGLAVSWLHAAFATRHGNPVGTDEVQIWQLRSGEVLPVDTFQDTLAVAQVFG